MTAPARLTGLANEISHDHPSPASLTGLGNEMSPVKRQQRHPADVKMCFRYKLKPYFALQEVAKQAY